MRNPSLGNQPSDCQCGLRLMTRLNDYRDHGWEGNGHREGVAYKMVHQCEGLSQVVVVGWNLWHFTDGSVLLCLHCAPCARTNMAI